MKNNTDGHIIANSYTSEKADFSGKFSTTLLDTWVFEKVKDFLRENRENVSLHGEKTVFFLHLLGLDTG